MHVENGEVTTVTEMCIRDSLETGRVYISSQNHGYAVVSSTIDPEIADEYFNNVNDRTCEGVRLSLIHI